MLARVGSDEVSSDFSNEMDPVLPLGVVLPEQLSDFFDERGYHPSTAAEYRGNARLRVRSKAVMEFEEVPQSLRAIFADMPRRATVLVKDLSRSGIGILFHYQIFPTQRLGIEFQGRYLDVSVVRCRKISSKCYEIGATVLQTYAL